MCPPNAPYYTLAIREDDTWAAAYGAFTYDDVLDKLTDYSGHGTKLKDLRIITTSAQQESIDRKIEELNSGRMR